MFGKYLNQSIKGIYTVGLSRLERYDCHENGRLTRLKAIIEDNEKLLLPYSTAHIGDFFSGYDGTVERQTLIDSDLEYITKLSEDLCLFNTGQAILAGYQDPKNLFKQRIDSAIYPKTLA